MWIHEHKDWPRFTWDVETLAFKLADVRHRQGRLLGRMEGLSFELKREATLRTLTSDVVKSSAIEGENLDPKRSSFFHSAPSGESISPVLYAQAAMSRASSK